MAPGYRRSERGVALITALLVVALATAAAVAMVSRQQLDIRRTGNLLLAEQARHYAYGAEAWGVAQLERDDRASDSLEDEWASELPPLALDEGGAISGRIVELQGHFNLNNLAAEGLPGELARERFARLLKQLELDPALLQAITDWIDPDSEPRHPDGAEDYHYLGLTPAYRCANTPLVSISELRRIRGVDAEVYARLAPHITALPEATPLNINTADTEQLLTLADGLVRGEIETLVEKRGNGAFAGVTQLLQDSAFAGHEIKDGALDVASRYFMIESHTTIGRIHLDLYTLVRRDAQGRVAVVRRAQGEL